MVWGCCGDWRGGVGMGWGLAHARPVQGIDSDNVVSFAPEDIIGRPVIHGVKWKFSRIVQWFDSHWSFHQNPKNMYGWRKCKPNILWSVLAGAYLGIIVVASSIVTSAHTLLEMLYLYSHTARNVLLIESQYSTQCFRIECVLILCDTNVHTYPRLLILTRIEYKPNKLTVRILCQGPYQPRQAWEKPLIIGWGGLKYLVRSK